MLLFEEDQSLIWAIHRAITAIGGGFSRIGPRQRPFDITDRSLSYPLESETVTNSTLLIAALIAPAGVILIGSLFVGTGPRRKPSSKAASWRRRLWEWNTGWMGLALSLAIAFIIANGAKEVLGKPRPNLLARCSPDLSKRLEATVGGIGDQIEEGITLYNTKICRNQGAILDEGFRSFPSGHSACTRYIPTPCSWALTVPQFLLQGWCTSHSGYVPNSAFPFPSLVLETTAP